VVMPGMTGPTLAARLKEMRPALKVMYMSGYADAIIAEKLAASDTPFIQKPFTPIDLVDIVRRTLDG
ncbi:MAG TPA: response regulator, partial [Vicinamibacterales bacterium]|nr:response regulator [Vicinamibacterales bacterium]